MAPCAAGCERGPLLHTTRLLPHLAPHLGQFNDETAQGGHWRVLSWLMIQDIFMNVHSNLVFFFFFGGGNTEEGRNPKVRFLMQNLSILFSFSLQHISNYFLRPEYIMIQRYTSPNRIKKHTGGWGGVTSLTPCGFSSSRWRRMTVAIVSQHRESPDACLVHRALTLSPTRLLG